MTALEQGKISSAQIIFLVVGFGLGTSVILQPGGGAKQDAWLAIILGLAEGIGIAMIYLALANRFPGRTLIQINDLVWGPYLGKVFSAAFLLFVFHLGSLVITNAKDFIQFVALIYTPASVSVLFEVLICIIAAAAGLEVMGRSAVVLVIFVASTLFIMDLLLLPRFVMSNLKPVLETPLPQLILEGHAAATFPFGETVVFTMLIPFLKNTEKSRSSMIAGLVFAGLLLVTSSIRNIGVLGATAGYYIYPSYSVSHLINVGEVFTRLEALAGINFLITVFIKLSILLYVFMLGTAQLLRLKSYRTLAIPVWILISLAGTHNFSNVVVNLIAAKKLWPIYTLPFEVGIPLFTWLAALIRKLPREAS